MYRKGNKTMTEFTKTDLKVGYLVEDRAGNLKMVMATTRNLELIYEDRMTHGLVNMINDDLTSKTEEKFDIMKVWGFSPFAMYALHFDTNNRKLLWERKEKKKMTVAENEKELGYEVEIISD